MSDGSEIGSAIGSGVGLLLNVAVAGAVLKGVSNIANQMGEDSRYQRPYEPRPRYHEHVAKAMKAPKVPAVPKIQPIKAAKVVKSVKSTNSTYAKEDYFSPAAIMARSKKNSSM